MSSQHGTIVIHIYRDNFVRLLLMSLMMKVLSWHNCSWYSSLTPATVLSIPVDDTLSTQTMMIVSCGKTRDKSESNTPRDMMTMWDSTYPNLTSLVMMMHDLCSQLTLTKWITSSNFDSNFTSPTYLQPITSRSQIRNRIHSLTSNKVNT